MRKTAVVMERAGGGINNVVVNLKGLDETCRGLFLNRKEIKTGIKR
jgi:hypothetical protein